MIYIEKAEFQKLVKQHPDYIGKCLQDHTFNGITCKRGEWCGFESVITGDCTKGTTLIFQHIHFEIV